MEKFFELFFIAREGGLVLFYIINILFSDFFVLSIWISFYLKNFSFKNLLWGLALYIGPRNW